MPSRPVAAWQDCKFPNEAQRAWELRTGKRTRHEGTCEDRHCEDPICPVCGNPYSANRHGPYCLAGA